MNSALSPTPSSKARRGRATALRPARNQRKTFGLEHTREFLDKLLGDDIHAKRVLSLANGVAGILSGAVLSIHAIGQAYARLADIEPKSGIKQLDRLLSNKGIDLDVMMPLWIEFVIAARTSLVVALDWTDFDDDDHTTLCAYLITKHGRATPLAWKTYKKSELEGHRTGWEHDLVETMHRWIPPNVNVTLLADRGFGRPEALFAARTPRLGLRHSLSRQYPHGEQQRGGPSRRSVGPVDRTAAHAQECEGYRRPISSPSGRRRACAQDERGVVSRDIAVRPQSVGDRQRIRSSLPNRRDVPRYQGPPLRTRAEGESHSTRRPTGSFAVPLRDRPRTPHPARGRRRGGGPRSNPQVEHCQKAHALALPPRNLLVLVPPDDARRVVHTAGDGLRSNRP